MTANNNGHSNAFSATSAVSPNEVVLITGAGGSIGSSIARQFCVGAQHCCTPAWQNPIRTVVLLDHSEQNLYEIQSELSSSNANESTRVIAILGDVNDAPLLDELFEKHQPTQIFHAAAFKHVPLMEENPIAVIRNNILGTWTLAASAQKHRARRLTMISTDKAANPRSIMGAAKRVAELVLARLDTPATRMRSVRLGNVLGSTGSVVPLFQRQIQTGGPVTVTHPEARRYFISLEEATDLILAAASLQDPGTLFVPDLTAPVKILDLANKMIRESTASSAHKHNGENAAAATGGDPDENVSMLCDSSSADAASPEEPIEIVFTGLRPGEKLHEELLSSTESAKPTSHPKLRSVDGPLPSTSSLDSAITLISEKVQARDLSALLDIIRALVPEYQPSQLVSTQVCTALSTAAKA